MNSFRGLLASRPRKAGLIIAVMVVALVAGTYAYLASLPSGGPRVTITSPPLEFSIEPNKIDFQQSENITIKFYTSNIGNDTVMLTWLGYYLYYDTWMPFDFYIVDANNTVIYQWTRTRGELEVPKDITLNPSEKLERIYVWNQKSNYLNDAQVLVETQIPKGTYEIRGILGPILIDRTDDWSKPKITLETPPIAFVVR